MQLVVISLEPWDEIWRRNQWLIEGLLDRDPLLKVLFVEPRHDPLHAIVRRVRPTVGRGVRAAPAQHTKHADRLWVTTGNKLLPRRIGRNSDRRWATGVLKAVERLGFSDPILWVNDPQGALVAEVTDWPVLYDITDDWTVADRTPAETARITRQEAFLLRRADQVVVCSERLLETKQAAHAPVTVIHNGVDTTAYETTGPRPTDLPPTKTVVYVGTLHRDRLDLELTAAVARALPSDARLVLVGPNALDSADDQRLRQARAVVLGPRPSDHIPAYLQAAEVLIVPHVVTAFTESLDPIKLYEYLAARRPIVSTLVAGFRDEPSVISVETEHFSDSVIRALTAGPSTTAMDIGSFEWSQRVAQAAVLLHSMSTPPPTNE